MNTIKLQLKLIMHPKFNIKAEYIRRKSLEKKKNQVKPLPKTVKAHIVKSAIEGVVFIKTNNLTKIFIGELITFTVRKNIYSRSKKLKGMVIGLSNNLAEIMLFGDTSKISPGDSWNNSNKIASIPCGPQLLGRVIDCIGNTLDGRNPSAKSYNIFAKVPGVCARERVCQPIFTGILSIDSLVPIGKGQRQLIIGDRKIGKTSIAIETIINQQYTLCGSCSGFNGTFCFYVAIGQKLSSIRRIIYRLKKKGALHYTTIIVASASDSAGSQFLAPYSGCTLAEWFRNRGKHSLIVYDDLGKQAIAYRQMSLLLNKPPGREAFPGDIFYVHSRLLERSAKLSTKLGGGSLTALPVVETLQGDLASYIPTNLISITDGQIYLDSDIFKKGVIPAVDFSLSVSRVGSKAQVPILKDLSKSFLTQIKKYRQLELFQSFGSDIDAETRYHLNRGSRAIEMLKQRYIYFGIEEQIFIMYTTMDGYWDDISLEKLPEAKLFFLTYLNQFTTIDSNVPELSVWLQSVRCALLSSKFNVEDKQNKIWLSLFFKFFKPYLMDNITSIK